MEVAVPLTSLSHGAGCGCKLPAAALLPIVRGLPAATAPELMVGSATGDDAAVWRISDDLALVQTVDFFTPVVDDPYDFGRIAAANALSDVYAMGGRPLTALNLVAWPLERLGPDALGEVLRGGMDVVRAAGAEVVGGHSIDDPEPKYGLAVTGAVHPDAVVTNAGGRAGDALVLTKPLGVGAAVTARKRGAADDALLARAVETMTALNAEASAAAVAAGASAMTDVTGFGLLGHLHGLARESGLAAELRADAVPALEGIEALLADDGAVSGGSARNREYAEAFATFAPGVAAWRARLVCDATTSGGLLVAVDPARAGAVPGAVVGRLVAGEPGAIAVS
ncbi:MAG: selenide, water dikinase [Solirubrobacteraceae bacterium]|jgi:selenide,water dikinase|nr:selenide, water dikinase [Solirubrobacteraceae bacterium]